MTHIETNQFNENDLLGKIDGHLQDAMAAADGEQAVDEYASKNKALDAYDRRFEALNDRIDQANFQRHVREASASRQTGADLNIGGAADAIDGLDAYRNLLDENLAAVMSKWADAPYDAKSVDFSSEATNLANLLQSRITLEGQLATQQQQVQALRDLGAQLTAARQSGDTAAIARLEGEISAKYAQMPDTTNPPQPDGKGGFYTLPGPTQPQVIVGNNAGYGNGGGYGYHGYADGYSGGYGQNYGTQNQGQQQTYITADQAIIELISSAESTVSSTSGSLSSTTGQMGQYQNLTNDQLTVRIAELRNSTPSGYFSTLRPELELNGNSNVMTLEELGAIKEFVQKTKERVTAVMAALARVIGMVGDTLLGVARLQS